MAVQKTMSRPRKILTGLAALIQEFSTFDAVAADCGIPKEDARMLELLTSVSDPSWFLKKHAAILGRMFKGNIDGVSRFLSFCANINSQTARRFLSHVFIDGPGTEIIALFQLENKELMKLMADNGIKISLKGLERLRERMAKEEAEWFSCSENRYHWAVQEFFGVEVSTFRDGPPSWSPQLGNAMTRHLGKKLHRLLQKGLDRFRDLDTEQITDTPLEYGELEELNSKRRVRSNGNDAKAGCQPTRQSRSPNGASPRAARRATRRRA